MHYEEFEWRLFREGSLSAKMKGEMMDHLYKCDPCLRVYLSTMEGKQEALGTAAANSVSFRKRRRFGSVNHSFWKPVAVSAMALAVFALMLFSPQGRTAWAQIRDSLYEIGNTFMQRFGLDENSPFVSNIGQPAITETGTPDIENIEVILDQVIVEAYSFSYSILVSGDLPEEVTHVRFFEWIEVDGETPLKSGGGTSYRLKDDPNVILYTMTFNSDINLFDKDTRHVKITSNDMNLTGAGVNHRISGPWEFEFDLNTKALEPDTRIFQLSETITLGKILYSIEQLQISPVRQRFVVHKYQLDEQGNSLPEPASFSEGNLAGFLLQTEDGGQAAFKIATVSSDEKGVVLFYEPTNSQFDMLDQSGSWGVTPYVSRREFIPNDSEFNGYSPVEDGMFRIENIKANSAEH